MKRSLHKGLRKSTRAPAPRHGKSLRPSERAHVRKSIRPSARPSARVPPIPLRGFEHAHRYWDSSARAWIVQVLPGEFYVSQSNEVIATVLGSCVSTCIRDPNTGLGGMNHFMLPLSPGKAGSSDALRYGSFAVERLLNELIKRGAHRATLEVKVFGGGRIIRGMSDIGLSNIAFVRTYLKDEGIPIAREDVGGRSARRLRYYPQSGRALVKHLEPLEATNIADREREFLEVLSHERPTGDIELF